MKNRLNSEEPIFGKNNILGFQNDVYTSAFS